MTDTFKFLIGNRKDNLKINNQIFLLKIALVDIKLVSLDSKFSHFDDPTIGGMNFSHI